MAPPTQPDASASRQSRRRETVLVLSVLVLLVAALLSTVVIESHIAAVHSSSELGPFELTGSNPGVSLAIPHCSYVRVTWEVTNGARANFSVMPPPEVSTSNCTGPPPSNATCLPSGCQPYGPNPVCFETGLSGTCSFTASQTEYGFELWAQSRSGLSGAAVSFTISYT